MISQHGKKLKIIDGYKMRFHKILNGDVKRWCCVNKTCIAYMKTDMSENTIIDSSLNHNHDLESEGKMMRQVIRNSVKRKAQEELCERPLKLIHLELKNKKTDSLTTTDISCIRKGIYAARRSILPKKPTNIQEVHSSLNSLEIKTFDNETFLLVNDSNKNLVMFSCKKNLATLCTVKTIYVDGTFKYCPKFFLQLFTIHGLNNGYYIPLVFFLLNNKQTELYSSCFLALKNECTKLNLCLNPEIMYADFEKSIHMGAKNVWPNIITKGCRFHLGQAWWRKVQNLGLSTHYCDDVSEIGQFLKNIFGLPMLNEHDIEMNFTEDFMSIKPNDEKLNQFMDYLVENYIDTQSDFPPHTWAEMSSSSERTTNACESFHSKFNSCFYTPHPDIYSFLEILKKIQIDT
ncbi:Uncharacterized protein FWK35_00038294, partial [Aphis craccivora]